MRNKVSYFILCHRFENTLYIEILITNIAIKYSFLIRIKSHVCAEVATRTFDIFIFCSIAPVAIQRNCLVSVIEADALERSLDTTLTDKNVAVVTRFARSLLTVVKLRRNSTSGGPGSSRIPVAVNEIVKAERNLG